MTPTVARGGSPSGFAKVADRGKGLEIGIGIGGNEGAGKPESKFGGRGGGDREILGMRLARSLFRALLRRNRGTNCAECSADRMMRLWMLHRLLI